MSPEKRINRQKLIKRAADLLPHYGEVYTESLLWCERNSSTGIRHITTAIKMAKRKITLTK